MGWIGELKTSGTHYLVTDVKSLAKYSEKFACIWAVSRCNLIQVTFLNRRQDLHLWYCGMVNTEKYCNC